MKIIKNYKQTLILILGIILGILLGLLLKEKASILTPLGDLFLNMLLIIIVPLIFLSITTSIYKMNEPKRVSKTLVVTFIMFLVTSIVAALIGIASTYSTKLVSNKDSDIIKENLSLEEIPNEETELNILDKTVKVLSTNDFHKLLSKDNIVALIVVSILVGLSMIMSHDKAKPFYNLLESANDILMNFIKIIMYYAPVGLCCYIAGLVGTFGKSIVIGYFKTFIVYLIVSLLVYFLLYSLYAFIGGGKEGVKRFWKNILVPSVTSLATCSSAASMPVNIEYTKKMGVPNDITETTISLGTSFHKDGSVIGSVFKIMFLVYLFNDINNVSVLSVLGISLIATLLVTAVPIGGGTLSETLIITMLGYPLGALPILTIIATIIDPPATLLNVVGDSTCAIMASRFIEGRNWIKKYKKKIKNILIIKKIW